MTKRCLQKPNMTPNHPHGPKNGSKSHFFSFCMENTHFYEFCHHGFQNGLKTLIVDENRSILAQFKAKTMLFHVVQSASLSRFLGWFGVILGCFEQVLVIFGPRTPSNGHIWALKWPKNEPKIDFRKNSLHHCWTFGSGLRSF